MTDPDALAAVNPATPLDQLARIASERPDLRATIAANPSTYDALLDWLAAFHDPQVDAVLALRRRPTAPPPGPPTYATYGTMPYVAFAPAPREKFVEPMRGLPLRWSTYTARYGVSLALLAFAGVFPFTLIYFIGTSIPFDYDLATVIERIVTAVVAAIGIAVAPSTIGRRLVAGVIVAAALTYEFSDIWRLLLNDFGYSQYSPQYTAWLFGVVVTGMGVPVAAWLVLRGRPPVSFVLVSVVSIVGFGLIELTLLISHTAAYAAVGLIQSFVEIVLIVGAIWLARAIHASRRPRAI